MKFKLITSFMIILMLGVTTLPLIHTVYAQTATNTMVLSTKGSVSESSNFHGAIMWTVINGNNGLIIIQSPAGRGMAHISIYPSSNCSSSNGVCLMSTVTDVGQIAAFKVGDTARFVIDVNAKQEIVSILTGTLAGFDVTVDLTKTWSKNIASTPSVNPTNSSPSTVNATSTNSTSTQHAPKHLSINLAENMNLRSR